MTELKALFLACLIGLSGCAMVKSQREVPVAEQASVTGVVRFYVCGVPAAMIIITDNGLWMYADPLSVSDPVVAEIINVALQIVPPGSVYNVEMNNKGSPLNDEYGDCEVDEKLEQINHVR